MSQIRIKVKFSYNAVFIAELNFPQNTELKEICKNFCEYKGIDFYSVFFFS